MENDRDEPTTPSTTATTEDGPDGPTEKRRRGGLARARRLSAEERKKIASDAARARWATHGARMPRATHVGSLRIGDVTIPCAVLDDGRRVLTQEGFLNAIGRTGNPKQGHGGEVFDTPVFLSAKNLKPFISDDLLRSSTPVMFEPKTGGGVKVLSDSTDAPVPRLTAYGYPAELLSDVCWVFINAQIAHKLLPAQEHIGERCKMLVKQFGKLGIVALIDEATGYQADRERDELRRILEQYIVEEMRRWVSTFPTEFFKQVYRLHGWVYKSGDTRTPRYVGRFIDKHVYQPLPPGVRAELRSRNPVVKNGRRKHKHFMFLTEEIGVPHLEEQIRAVTLLMKGADNKSAFERAFKRVFPITGDQVELDLSLPEQDEDE